MKPVMKYYGKAEDTSILNEPWKSYPYEFHVNDNIYSSTKVEQWIKDNIGNRAVKYDGDAVGGTRFILFSEEEDAMAFKLRWE